MKLLLVDDGDEERARIYRALGEARRRFKGRPPTVVTEELAKAFALADCGDSHTEISSSPANVAPDRTLEEE